jgi:hypothetical protein
MFHPTRPQGLDSVRSLVHRACGTGEVEDVVHRATLDRMADVPFDNSKREPPHRCSMFASRPVSCRKTRLRSSPRLRLSVKCCPRSGTPPQMRQTQPSARHKLSQRLVSLALGVATHNGGSIARFRRRIVRLMASPTCNGRAMRDGRFYDIVAVPTTHALRSTKIVLLRDLFASDLATMSTSSLIVTSSSVPKLRGSRWSEAPCK